MKFQVNRFVVFLLVFTGIINPGKMYGQQRDFSQSNSFPNIFAPYFPRQIAMPRMSSSDRIHRLIQDGMLRLSVQDLIALALENNLDIAVERFRLADAQAEVLRAKSGGGTLGVGGAGSVAGQSGGGAGGAGASSGAGGALGGGGASSVGSSSSLDPVVGFDFNWDRREIPLGNTVVLGVPALVNQRTNYSGFYSQGFLTGTSVNMRLSGVRSSTNSLNSLFNPQVTTLFSVGISQPLLRGFGYGINATSIRIARNNLKWTDEIFRSQVIFTVSQVLTLYWDLIFFRDNLRVAEESLALAERTLRDNQRRVEIGDLARMEVVRSKSEVAARKRDLITAQTSLQQHENQIKIAISRKMGPELANARIEAIDPFPVPHEADIPPVEDAIQEAWRNRPEVATATIDLRNQRLTLKSSRNRLLPSFNLFASYSGDGLSGNRVLRDVDGTIIDVLPGGLGQAFTQAFHGNFPDYAYGATLRIPIRNRAAQASHARALIQDRRLRLRAQQTRNIIEQQVRNAVIGLRQSKAQIEAAENAVVMAEQTLEGEQKKYQLGKATLLSVIWAQRDLNGAGMSLNTAYSGYAKALTELHRAMGTSLDTNSINISDARIGKVERPPNIPGSSLER